MANPEHVEILRQGVEVWNRWKEENTKLKPDLSEADLHGVDLRDANLGETDLSKTGFWGADLSGANLNGANLIGASLNYANLSKANLSEADLSETGFLGANFVGANLIFADFKNAILINANLSEANLSETYLRGGSLSKATLSKADLSKANLSEANLLETNFEKANLSEADLSKATLTEANLSNADLVGANLSGADLVCADLSGANLKKAYLYSVDLSGANLSQANLVEALLENSTLVETNFKGTNINSSRIYGISAWNLKLSKKTQQLNLRITNNDEPVITVDNLEVAQFVHLLLRNEKIRDVIDTIGEKGVLILGRFTPERKVVLDAIRNKLRQLGFVPMMFDFEKPTQRDFTETIKTLSGMSRFIIADITNPKSSPLELQATMPDYMIPFVPIIHESEEPFSMFRDLKQKYGDWVLDVLEYDSPENLINVLNDAVVQPALDKAYELIDKKSESIKKRHVKDYRK